MAQARNLGKLETLGVSLVKNGANRKRFAITKAETMDAEAIEVLKAILEETELTDEAALDAVLKAKLGEKQANAVKGAMRLLNAFKDDAAVKALLDHMTELVGTPSSADKNKPEKGEETPMDKNKVTKICDLSAYAASVQKALENVPEEQRAMFGGVLQAIWKEADDRAKQADEKVAKAEERATNTEEILKAERDNRLTKEFISKAERDFASIPGKAEELGPVLKALNDLDPKLCEQIQGVLKGANDLLKESKAFSELGRSGSAGLNGGTAWEAMQKAAQAAAQ